MKRIIVPILVLSLLIIPTFATSKLLQTAIRDDGLVSNVKKAIETKSASFTYAVGDPAPLIDTTSAEVVVTLPPITDWDDEAYRHEIELAHVAGTNNVKVQLDGVETFAWGNTYFNLGTSFKGFSFAAIRNGAMTKYGILRNITIHATAERTVAWAATNFSGTTIIPWDNELHNNQPEFFVYTAGAAARYTILTTGTYNVSYTVDFNSTGGATAWTATAQVYKNGVALGGTIISTGNSKNGDQSSSMVADQFDFTAGDYFDLRVIQSGLTGTLLRSKFNISLDL